MTLANEGCLLRIYIGQDDRRDGLPLYEWIVRRAREHGLAGATVLRGKEGFGAHSRLHPGSLLRLSSDLPLAVEIVDTRERIEAFLPLVDGAVAEGMATLGRVEIRICRDGVKGEPS